MQNKKLKIVVDSAIPFLEGVLDPYAEVVRCPGSQITAEVVRDADALLIRTRTRCNKALLEGSSVRFIATATIGFDHIDLGYCHLRGIEVTSAAGCNARGVLQWVAGVLVWLARREGWRPEERTLGIVGVGHVGSLIKEYAEAWGFKVLCCDPPREEREGLGFLPLEEVAARADILTFHTPLDASTHHLCNEKLLSLMHPNAVIINASRGEVADEQALLATSRTVLLDVWEHEPDILAELLEKVPIATTHIAGYSLQGKANASALTIRALAHHFRLPLTEWYPSEVEPSRPRPIDWEELCATIADHLDLEGETRRLKADRTRFEQIRDSYPYRAEYF